MKRRIGRFFDIVAISLIFGYSIMLSLQTPTTAKASAADGILNVEEMFTERDLEQEPDLSKAEYYTIQDEDEILISAGGVYCFSGSGEEVTITVEADKEEKVQIVLDGVEIVNEDFPCIYVKEADKVFVTTISDSSLSVTGDFVKDGDTKTDGAIFCRSDLVCNGTASLTISSTDNGIVGKDDVKFTGGSYIIDAASKAIEANDSIRIADGSFGLTAGTDGLHAENDDDDTLGYIYIEDGRFTIDAGDDGIHGTSLVQVKGGSFTISAAEGIEGTVIVIDGGDISISSWDDGVNAAQKSKSYVPSFEMNGGTLTIVMAGGDTDGIDSNANLTINGGTIDITGQSAIDFDGNGAFNGGTLIVNGQQVGSLPNQMGGGMGGRMGGNEWGNKGGRGMGGRTR